MRKLFGVLLGGLVWASAQAETKPPLDLTFKAERIQAISYVKFGPEPNESIIDGCTSLMKGFAVRSYHPGYGDKVNQNNYGPVFKCRFGDENPSFLAMGALTNSQWGATFVVGFGKQLDILAFDGPFRTRVHYYVGAEIDAISYEWPARKITYFGVAPLWHQGVGLRFAGKPATVFAEIAVEEHHLPVDRIKLYEVWGKLTLKF